MEPREKWNEKGKLGPQVGTEGKSYAIPTVTRAGEKRSIPLSEIKKSIEKFYAFAKSRPHLNFFVAQGVEGNLNGYSAQEMVSIYSGEIPDNVYFDEGFALLLEKQTLCESCEKHPARPLHTCPYKEEINNLTETCNCCEKCEHECCMDI